MKYIKQNLNIVRAISLFKYLMPQLANITSLLHFLTRILQKVIREEIERDRSRNKNLIRNHQMASSSLIISLSLLASLLLLVLPSVHGMTRFNYIFTE